MTNNSTKNAKTTSAKIRASRILIAILAATASIGMVAVGTSSTAQASASGCSAWGAKTVGGIPVAKGVYCVGLNGTGRRVDTVVGSFNAAGSVCNWNITVELFDSSGRWYRTIEGGKNWGCTWKGSAAIGVFQNVQRGSMCSTLKQNGARIQSVCHSIY